MQDRLQEQPEFTPGDRFLLRRGIYALDCTREAEWWDEDATFFDTFPDGLRGSVVETGIWEQNPENPADTTFYFTLRLDACPHRKIFYIADGFGGGPFEQVAAKAINLN